MSAFVLDNGPSDHNPFIQDFAFTNVLGEFRACTWNVNHGSNADEVEETFTDIAHNYRADVLILQEVKAGRGIQNLLSRLGYESKAVRPEFCIAWGRGHWSFVKMYRPLMSPTKYWTMNYALVVVLKHNETGKLVKFMSYHPPAHVQAPPGKHRFVGFKTVTKVLHEVVRRWNRMARRSVQHLDACCFAGDDNVDELRGWAPKDEWEFMLNGPLTQVRAPRGTHGPRKIDDFRITKGLQAVGEHHAA